MWEVIFIIVIGFFIFKLFSNSENSDKEIYPPKNSYLSREEKPLICQERFDEIKEIDDLFKNYSGMDTREKRGEIFEEYCQWLLEKKGYKTDQASKTQEFSVSNKGDGGVDLVYKGSKDNVLIQCKLGSHCISGQNIVGADLVREFIGTLVMNNCKRGIFISKQRFSNEALAEVNKLYSNSPKNSKFYVYCIDKNNLNKFINGELNFTFLEEESDKKPLHLIHPGKWYGIRKELEKEKIQPPYKN